MRRSNFLRLRSQYARMCLRLSLLFPNIDRGTIKTLAWEMAANIESIDPAPPYHTKE